MLFRSFLFSRVLLQQTFFHVFERIVQLKGRQTSSSEADAATKEENKLVVLLGGFPRSVSQLCDVFRHRFIVPLHAATIFTAPTDVRMQRMKQREVVPLSLHVSGSSVVCSSYSYVRDESYPENF